MNLVPEFKLNELHVAENFPHPPSHKQYLCVGFVWYGLTEQSLFVASIMFRYRAVLMLSCYELSNHRHANRTSYTIYSCIMSSSSDNIEHCETPTYSSDLD